MQIIKIVSVVLILTILGILVGSNLSSMVTIVLLSQPTIRFPIGIWLSIALASGILSSSLIQLLLFFQQGSLKKKIRQLQTRLQQQGEDVFTYTSPTEPEPEIVDSPPQDRRFSFKGIGNRRVVNDDLNIPMVDRSNSINDRDWEDEEIDHPQEDWEDAPSPVSEVIPDRVQFKPTQNRQPEFEPIDEVYDADFRLIKPPYKGSIEDDDEDEADDYPEPIYTDTSKRQTDLDEEDWGFEFDDDTDVRKNRTRKI